MRRWLLAVAVLVGPAVGLASADYIILKVDLNKLYHAPPPVIDPKGGQPPVQPPPQPADPKNAAQDPKEPPVWAYAYLEQQKKVKISPSAAYPKWYTVDHRWSKSQIALDAQAVAKHIVWPSALGGFKERAASLKKEGNKTAEKLLVLAEWALEHGLFAECESTMAELKEFEPDNAKVRAFQKTLDALGTAPTSDDPAAAPLLKEKSDYKVVLSEQGHFKMLTNVKSPKTDPGVLRRLARMEDTYKGFFYWFALKGRPLNVPAHRLVAVLVKTDWSDSKEFFETYDSFNQPMYVGDGFIAQRDNVVILASTPFLASMPYDPSFHTLQKNNHLKFPEYKVTSADLLGDPKDSKILKKQQQLGRRLQVMQLAAILENAMEEDAETATVSHESARQLAAATGLIPRNVNTAEWARFGLASFFETAPHGFYTTVGGPNWSQLVRWRYLLKKRILTSENAKNILLDVVGDKYFQQADRSRRQLYETSESSENVELKAHKDMRLAQATAWSLTHFLAREHLSKLLAYYAELSSLPRDVEYDSEVLRGCFARAFGLLTKDPAGGPKQALDMARVDKLAREWFSAIEERPIDIPGYQEEEFERLKDEDNPPPPPKTDPNSTGTNPNPGNRPGIRPGGRPSGPGGRPSGPGGRPSGPGGRPGGGRYGPGGG